MRISTLYVHYQGVQNMLQQQSKLVDTQNQLARGVKHLSPSDDPGATARTLQLNEVIAQMTQYEENAVFATQRLNLEETTLDSVNNVLIRVKELTVQAGNVGTYDEEGRKAIASELRERLDELFDYANTKDASGEYLFSGFQSGTQPFSHDGQGNFTYNGDQGQMALQIASNRQVIVNDSGAEVFQMIRTGNGVFNVDANSTNGGNAQISTGSVVTPGMYQPHDFAIEMDEVFSVTANPGNSVGTLAVVASTASNPEDAHFTSPVDIYFDPANPAGTFDVLDRNTGEILQDDVVYTSGMSVSQHGWQVQLSGVPQPGDRMSLTANPPEYEYSVINRTTGATVLAAQPYTDGGAIRFNGIEVAISGEPVDGDVFTVEASRNQDIFTTLSNLISSLEAPVSTNVRGSFGGDYINNGFGAGETVTFDLNFDGQTINFSVTPATPTNDEVATEMMATIAALPTIVTNLDGSYTLPGTTPGASVTFRRVGDNIEFITEGGNVDQVNSLSITNLADAATNDAVLSVTGGGNSLTTQTTVAAAVVGDGASFLAGTPHTAWLSQQIDSAMNNFDRSMDRIVEVQTSIGGRLNSIDSQLADNEDRKLNLQSIRSEIRDLDFAEAISNLTFQTTALQAAQQTFVKIQNLSLFNYL